VLFLPGRPGGGGGKKGKKTEQELRVAHNFDFKKKKKKEKKRRELRKFPELFDLADARAKDGEEKKKEGVRSARES